MVLVNEQPHTEDNMNIKTKPVPNCPLCDEPMKLRRPKSQDTWQPFWGCSTYPECSGVLDINPDTGLPEKDDDWLYDEEY